MSQSSERRVEVTLDPALFNFITETLPYLGYEGVEDLVREAVALRMEELLRLATLAHENRTAQQSDDITEKDFTEPRMITVTLEVFEPFHDFLKKYLAFFGSKMTLEELIQQMVYEESRRLYSALTEFTNDNNHYVGKHSWFTKHPEVAQTIRDCEETEKTTGP
ncbi:MAG: hypothetical protein NWF00_06660 [Candidatus Bathyarchaeota archaeon]|nr:hypothetical protein [Candidatus Bathyarchaeota archaeon]